MTRILQKTKMFNQVLKIFKKLLENLWNKFKANIRKTWGDATTGPVHINLFV